MRLLLVLLVAMLAGCTHSESQQRSDDLFINISGDDPFAVTLPMPIDASTDVAHWIGSLRVSSGNATLAFEDGRVRIAGDGHVSIESLTRRTVPCCGDLRQVGWTEQTVEGSIPILVQGANVTFSLRHESTTCQGACDPPEDAVVCSRIYEIAGRLDARMHDVAPRTDDTQCYSF